MCLELHWDRKSLNGKVSGLELSKNRKNIYIFCKKL